MSTASSFAAAVGVPVPPISIIDVGAMAEGDDRYAGLLAQGLASVVGFEPNAAELARLLARAQPRRRYLPHCLGKGGPAVLHVTHYPGCTSLYRPNAALINLFQSMSAQERGNFFVVREEPIETKRLDDIAECPAADLLKLDVQGAELDVLEGARNRLAQTLVIEAEVEFVPLYENQPLFSDVEQFLRAEGFAVHKMIDIAGRALRPFRLNESDKMPFSQLLWADAVFVRDFTRLERFSDDDLLKSAAILSETYRSDDLAYHFLREYDRRRGTQTSASFVEYATAKGIEVMFMTFRP